VARNKDLQYYLGLNYDVIVRRYEDEGQIMYTAFTSELDRNAFYGVGDTPKEAIDSLEKVKEELFEYYLEEGYGIPEPEHEYESLPSGKFIVRTSPKVHRDLISMAKKNKQSLNSYINYIFAEYITLEKAGDTVKSILEKQIYQDWIFGIGRQFYDREISKEKEISGKSKYEKATA
jgi:predicted HicB family RNase H-like nuclease